MIGWVTELLVERVLKPQDNDDRGELRAYLNPEARAIDVQPSDVDVLRSTTRPTGDDEIGGTLGLRHDVVIGVKIEHGELSEATRLRDGVVLDLILRLTGPAALEGRTSPETGEEIERVTFLIDYAPLPGTENVTVEFASITVSVFTRLPR